VNRPSIVKLECSGADHTFSSGSAHDHMIGRLLEWLRAQFAGRFPS
jgi:hypothetical protein